MTDEQVKFFDTLKLIQKDAIFAVTCNKEKYENIEDMLKDVTYETIYSIMELLDGYQSEDIKCSVINEKTENILNKDIEFHNQCEEFLDCTDI